MADFYLMNGDKEAKQANLYGITVDTEKPITGVVQNNNVEWLSDVMFERGAIDLTWNEHLENCDNEDHDRCGPDEHGTILIGSWRKVGEEYEPDQSGEYAAIVRESVTQVVWSAFTKRCTNCSPCYPGQADLDSPDDNGFLCFDLPPDLYGERI